MNFVTQRQQCFPKTLSPVKEYELLDPTTSLQDIHILHRGSAQIPTGHLVQ
jgi:hypothetical protein